ncbi:MAG: FxLYD domain-containing protein [Bryobacteraceae bacterium]
MAANKTTTPKKKQVSIPPWAIVIVLVVGAGLAGFLYLDRAAKRPPPPPPPLTTEARLYVRNLKLSGVEMKAHESYLKQSVVEITGSIENIGDRKLDLVELTCVFYDAYGQVVLRERVPIVSAKMGGVGPGENKQFRLPFDNIPESWNQMLPQLVIARIDFGK